MKNFIVIVFLIIITSVIIFYVFFEDVFGLNNVSEKSEVSQEIEEYLENEKVNVSKYLVYGTHLNIYGNININFETIKSTIKVNSAKLILKKEENLEEFEYNIEYKVENNTFDFCISDELNSAIDLEKLLIGKYIILLKIDYEIDSGNNVSKYYSLINNTDYENVTYYTITKNGGNNKIDIAFNGNLSNNSSSVMNINVEDKILPADVYDIVIDPGHGGKDCGATVDDCQYTESELNIKYAVALKEKLEELGLKVKLTRDDDTYIESYGTNGRYVLPNAVFAKYLFSIHLNSSDYTMEKGGLEIYLDSKLNTDFATLMAKNIIKNRGTTYSSKTEFKVSDGVYARNFNSDEITESKADAKLLNYEEYDITEATSYFGIIRETGGIATNAYMDGRNTEYGKNEYYNSNIGVESYLLELGYMTCEEDLNNIIYKKSEYVDSIADSIASQLGI